MAVRWAVYWALSWADWTDLLMAVQWAERKVEWLVVRWVHPWAARLAEKKVAGKAVRWADHLVALTAVQLAGQMVVPKELTTVWWRVAVRAPLSAALMAVQWVVPRVDSSDWSALLTAAQTVPLTAGPSAARSVCWRAVH